MVVVCDNADIKQDSTDCVLEKKRKQSVANVINKFIKRFFFLS